MVSASASHPLRPVSLLRLRPARTTTNCPRPPTTDHWLPHAASLALSFPALDRMCPVDAPQPHRPPPNLAQDHPTVGRAAATLADAVCGEMLRERVTSRTSSLASWRRRLLSESSCTVRVTERLRRLCRRLHMRDQR